MEREPAKPINKYLFYELLLQCFPDDIKQARKCIKVIPFAIPSNVEFTTIEELVK